MVYFELKKLIRITCKCMGWKFFMFSFNYRNMSSLTFSGYLYMLLEYLWNKPELQWNISIKKRKKKKKRL